MYPQHNNNKIKHIAKKKKKTTKKNLLHKEICRAYGLLNISQCWEGGTTEDMKAPPTCPMDSFHYLAIP
jgi:hypothetical protein